MTTTRWLLLLQSVLLAASSYFVVYANAFAAWFVEVQLETFHHYTPLTLTLVLFIHAILFSGATFASLKKQKFYLLAIFCTLTLILSAIIAIKAQATKESEITASIQSQKMIGDASIITGLKSGTGDGARAVDGPAAIVGAFITVDLSTAFILFCVALIVAGNNGSKVDAKVGAIYIAVSVAGAALSVWGFTNAIGDSIAKAGTLPLDAARYLANDIALALAGAGAGAIFMMLGWYLGKRAIEKE